MYQFKINDPHFLPHFSCVVELPLRAGEALFLSGDNGIGKTTLMHRFFETRDYKISVIEQGKLDFFYDRKVGALKHILLESQKADIDEESFQTAWLTFGLHQKENRFLSELSGGEGQALKLCLGLGLKRDIYFLDEPTQYLDLNTKTKLASLLFALKEKGKSLLIIEHDLKWFTSGATVVELAHVEDCLRISRTWTM